MKRRILVVFLLLALGCAQLSRAATQALQQQVSTTLAEQGLVGVVWAMVEPTGGIEVGAGGLRDARRDGAMNSTDRVHVGSIAKPLLAVGLLRLVSLGRVSLDDPVASILPGITFDNPWEATDPVRLRHLLDQTSGLDDARLWQVFSSGATPETPLAEAFSRDPAVLRVRSRPGTRFSYSNMGYTLAGMVVEAVTGQRYEDYLDRNLLSPLGMHDSTFGFVSQQGLHADLRLAMGHTENGSIQPAVPFYLRPAGQFTTTAADMGRFAQFLMGDGRVQGQAFVDPSLLRAMGRTPGTEASLAGLRAGYGLGLYTRDRNGAVGKCHGGSTIGYRAMVCIYPEARSAYFYAVNTDSETADRDALDRLLLVELGLPGHESTARISERSEDNGSSASEWEGYYVPSPNRSATFAWMDTVFGYLKVEAEPGGIRVATFAAPDVSLEDMDGQLYRTPGRRMASHALLISAERDRIVTTGSQSYERASLAWMLMHWASLVAGLAGLVWLAVAGVVRLAMGRVQASEPGMFGLAGALILLLPAPLIYFQPFMQLGDITAASSLIAAVTLMLPVLMLLGLWRHWQLRPSGMLARLNLVSMVFVLQFAFVLAGWNLLPLRLWH